MSNSLEHNNNAQRHQRVMQLLADAMEANTGERASFIVDSCHNDHELRSEIEKLLAHQNHVSGFLEETLFDGNSETESLIGIQVGAYRIVERLGRGGMGAVYLAERSDDEYQKQVAIKFIKRGLPLDVVQQRFRTERQILANLDHQNISRLLDGGRTDHGPYLVMEYVDGIAIDTYCDAQDLSTNKRLELFLKVCDAVAYAHRKSVVHRDIKPGNILVNKDGVPKLLDFGIAKLLQSDPDFDNHSTLSWRVMTPEYASPEQVRGDSITAATDLYSLGVVLYELLTGQRPYQLRGRTSDEVKQAICNELPAKPSSVIRSGPATKTEEEKPSMITANVKARAGAPDRVRRKLHGDLDNIVLMALRKEPERRYRSVAEFSEDINRYLDGKPIMARRDSVIYRSARFIKRHQVYSRATLIVAVVFLAVGALLGLFTGGGKRDGLLNGAAAVSPQLLEDCVPPPSDMVSWWPGENTAYDMHGANFGSVENQGSFAAGKVGQSFSLNRAQSQYLKIPDSNSLRMNKLTIESWVNFTSTVGGGCCNALYSKPFGDATHDSFSVWYMQNALHGGTCNENGCDAVVYVWAPTPGTWYHVAYTFDGSAHHLFVNGAEVAKGADTHSPAYDNHDLLIGADVERGNLDIFFDGKFDEIGLYSRALSAAEINTIFKAGARGKCRS